MAVTLQESILHGFTHFVGLGLPGSQTNGGNLGPGVQGVGFSVEELCQLKLILSIPKDLGTDLVCWRLAILCN